MCCLSVQLPEIPEGNFFFWYWVMVFYIKKKITLEKFVCVWSVAQLCPTLCDPMDCSLPDSVRGILQARILGWVTISSSRGSSQPRDWTRFSLHLLHWQESSVPLHYLGGPGKSLKLCKSGQNNHIWWSPVNQHFCNLHRAPPILKQIPDIITLSYKAVL